MEIKKKCWPELFERVRNGKKNVEIRLADFKIREGDILILEEYDPGKKEYTGRTIKKTVTNVNKADLLQFHEIKDIKKHGYWIIEMSD